MLRFLKKKKKKKGLISRKMGAYYWRNSFHLQEVSTIPSVRFLPTKSFKPQTTFPGKNVISEDRFLWFKGTIENRCVLIKKFQYYHVLEADNFYRDITVSSLMSGHKNVVKLLGCSLEFPRPVLVCEYPENGALSCIITAREVAWSLPWNVRLRIAKEIVDAVTYLHTFFPRTIIHRDLKIGNIFLDENWTVKLSTFSLSVLIPEGESGVYDIVCGTSGYMEPNYRNTGFVTENVDIYNFGIIMLILLTGKSDYTKDSGYNLNALPVYVAKLLERGLLTEVIDPSMLDSMSDNIPEHSRLQMEAFIELAFICVRFRPGENVSHMIDIARELKNIEKHTLRLIGQEECR